MYQQSTFGSLASQPHLHYPQHPATYYGGPPAQSNQAFQPLHDPGRQIEYGGSGSASASSNNHGQPPVGMMQAQAQTQAHALGQQTPYTSAPSVQASPAPYNVKSGASPPQHLSPYNSAQPQQQTPPQRFPMAAPPLPQTPANPQADAKSTASPQPPPSPGTQAREQQRVALLLEINMELLQEISSLQAQGKGGATNPQQLKSIPSVEKMASDEFIQTMRRVQANLAYLAPRADSHHGQRTPPGPAYMSPPPQMTGLQEKYGQLKSLFPGWGGLEAMTASPRPNGGMNTNGMNAGTPVQA